MKGNRIALVLLFILLWLAMLAPLAFGVTDQPAPIGTTVEVDGKLAATVRDKPVLIKITPGNDINLVPPAVPGTQPSTQPTTQPATRPSDPPENAGERPNAPFDASAVRITPGAGASANISRAVRSAASERTVLLQTGAVYDLADVLFPASRTSIGWYGDPEKPRPVVRQTGARRTIDFTGKRDLNVFGIDFDGSKTTGGAEGMWLYDFQRVAFVGCRIHGYGGNGIAAQAPSGRMSDGLLIRLTLIDNNAPRSAAHCAGLYADRTLNIVLTQSWVEENGGSTPFNHGAYNQTYNGPVTAIECAFVGNSSHGLQLRPGGWAKRCIFVDNPVAFTLGYVEGGPAKAGGVTGGLEDIVCVGGGKVGSQPRGWIGDVANCKDVVLRRILAAQDNQFTGYPTLNIKSGKSFADGTSELPRDQWKVRVEDFYVYGFNPKNGLFLNVGSGINAVKVNAGIAPPKRPDLRKLLAPFLAARDPSKTAEAVKMCFVAAGL